MRMSSFFVVQNSPQVYLNSCVSLIMLVVYCSSYWSIHWSVLCVWKVLMSGSVFFMLRPKLFSGTCICYHNVPHAIVWKSLEIAVCCVIRAASHFVSSFHVACDRVHIKTAMDKLMISNSKMLLLLIESAACAAMQCYFLNHMFANIISCPHSCNTLCGLPFVLASC